MADLADLSSEAAAGDDFAFRSLYRAGAARVAALSLSTGGEDAEDVASEPGCRSRAASARIAAMAADSAAGRGFLASGFHGELAGGNAAAAAFRAAMSTDGLFGYDDPGHGVGDQTRAAEDREGDEQDSD